MYAVATSAIASVDLLLRLLTGDRFSTDSLDVT